ncbi:MAG: LacI family DNA-binding transcriptional regulator [Planctomycetota bacterium]
MPVTIRQLATELGVSRQTVSSILSGRVENYRPETCARVVKAAKRMGYRPNGAAKAIFSKQMKAVGAVVVNTTGTVNLRPIYSLKAYELIIGANNQLNEADYMLSLVNVGGTENERESRAFREHLLDGLLVFGRTFEQTRRRIEAVAEHAVHVDTNYFAKHNCVRRDETAAGRLLAERAIAAGARRLVWIGIDEPEEHQHFSQQARQAGVVKAAKAARVPLEIVGFKNGAVRTWSREAVLEAVGLPSSKPLRKRDAADRVLLCYNEKITFWVVALLGEYGLGMGEHYRLGNCDLGSAAPPLAGLAGVRFERTRLGAAGAAMLLELIRTGKPVPSRVFADEFVDGKSLGG